MNKMTWIWIMAGLVILAVVDYMVIVDWLRRRREKVHFLLLGWFLPRNLNRYRQLSGQEKGRTGPLFYVFIVCINLALAAFLAFLVG